MWSMKYCYWWLPWENFEGRLKVIYGTSPGLIFWEVQYVSPMKLITLIRSYAQATFEFKLKDCAVICGHISCIWVLYLGKSTSETLLLLNTNRKSICKLLYSTVTMTLKAVSAIALLPNTKYRTLLTIMSQLHCADDAVIAWLSTYGS